MKQIFRSILINSIAIAVTAYIMPSISYGEQLSTLFMSAIVLGVANTFVKPVLSLVLLPISVITLGIAGWFINALILLLTTVLVPQFDILAWTFTFGNTSIYIPLFWSYIVTAFVLQFIIRMIHGIIHDD